MANKDFTVEGLESDLATMHPLISWRSVIAGLLITLLVLSGLVGLGLALGGINLSEDTQAGAIGIFTGVWFTVSALISLFVGSYFAARVSKFQTGRIGSAQGLVIAALFLGFFLYQIASTIGAIGGAAGSLAARTASLAGQGVQQAAQNQTISNTVMNYVEDSLGNLDLRSDPRTVANGVATRLLSGNLEGAQSYLVRQTGITQEEASTRIQELQNRANQTIGTAKAAAGEALETTGWSLFFLVLLGALAAVAGGALGSVTNFRKPLSREQRFTSHAHA